MSETRNKNYDQINETDLSDIRKRVDACSDRDPAHLSIGQIRMLLGEIDRLVSKHELGCARHDDGIQEEDCTCAEEKDKELAEAREPKATK